MVHTMQPDYIRNNLEMVRKKLDRADVRLMAVTKNRGIEEIEAAYKAGCRLFGENKVQEAMSKVDVFRKLDGIELHLIGHLQTNKVKEACAIFGCIESVDSLRLLAKIHDEAKKHGRPMRIFVQVNVSKDPKKFGIMPEELFEFFRNAHEYLSGGFVIVDGLMAIVEHTDDVEQRREFFRTMRKLIDDLKSLFPEGAIERMPLRFLSMGMSEDFEIAVEEGANLVRLGRVIFG